MQNETAFAGAFRKSGYPVGMTQAYQRAVDLLKGKSDLTPAMVQKFATALMADPKMLADMMGVERVRVEAQSFLARVLKDMRGSGVQENFDSQRHSGPALIGEESVQRPFDSHGSSGAPSPSGAVHISRESQALSGRPASQSKIDAMKRAADAIAVTIMDTHRMRNGRAIGDLQMHELTSLRAENVAEAALIRMIQNHSANADPFAKVREVVKVEDLQRFLQKAAEVADCT